MDNSTYNSIRKAEIMLKVGMVSAMIISLLFLTGFTFLSDNTCNDKYVIRKNVMGGKFYYTFSDNSSLWSTSDIPVGQSVCQNETGALVAITK